MDLIKTLKDVFSLAQKSNDVDMIQKVLSAQQCALEMQDRIQKLQIENSKLKDKISKDKNIEYYRSVPIITLKNQSPKIMYCGICYGKDEKLIPLQKTNSGSLCFCSNCRMSTYLDYSQDYEKLNNILKQL